RIPGANLLAFCKINTKAAVRSRRGGLGASSALGLRPAAPPSGTSRRPTLGGGAVSAVAERSDSPFSKACAYLNFRSGAKWAAYLAAAGIGLVYVALLMVLWLFVDLMVYRGRVPGYHDLTPVQRHHFEAEWDGQDEPARRQRCAKVGLSPALAKQEFAQLTPEQASALWRLHAWEVL